MGGSSSSTQQKQHEQNTQSTSAQKKPHVVTKSNPPQNKQSQQLITDKDINKIIDNINQKPQQSQTFLAEELYTMIQKQLQNNPFLRQYKQKKQQINKDHIIPLKASYNKIPTQFTSLKFNYLNNYNYNDRLIALGVLSMLIGVKSYRNARMYQLPLRTFKAVKNSVLIYFLVGLFIAPEIYNPLMN